MRKFFIILGSLVALGIIAFAFVWTATGSIADRANAFFAAGAGGDIDQAHAMLSAAARESTDPQALREFFTESGLTSFGDASWSNRSISPGRGELQGIVTTADGTAVPVKVILVKEQDQWMLLSVTRETAGIRAQPDLDAPALPDIDEQKALADRGMALFVASVKSGSMQDFYDGLSNIWKRQTSVEELEQVFGEFYRIPDFDWDQIGQLDPVLDRPSAIDADGVMTISGHYPSQPYRVMFQQRFYREGTEWRLLGFSAEM